MVPTFQSIHTLRRAQRLTRLIKMIVEGRRSTFRLLRPEKNPTDNKYIGLTAREF